MEKWSLEHPHDTPPYRFTPSPTFGHSSQVLAIVCPAPDDHVNVRMLCVPVIDGYPAEAGTKIAFGVGPEVAGESFDIGKLSRIVGRNNESEMMPVVVAPLGEGLMIDIVALELGGGRRVFAPMGSDPETVRRQVCDQEAARC